MRYWTAQLEQADALLFGRVTYEMMASAWWKPATGKWPDWIDDWQLPFAETIDQAKKYVLSSTLSQVDWNAELVTGDVGQAVQRLKQESGQGLWVGGVTLPLGWQICGLSTRTNSLCSRSLPDMGRRCSPACVRRGVPVGGSRRAIPTHASSGLTRTIRHIDST